jgi:NIMA (never in mitosis gene a)-related kinase
VKKNSDNNIYAMKEVKINTLGKADKEGCLNEIRLLASISSPYIVKYLDAF